MKHGFSSSSTKKEKKKTVGLSWKPVLIKFPLFHSEDFLIFLKDVLFTKNACIWFKKKHTNEYCEYYYNF